MFLEPAFMCAMYASDLGSTGSPETSRFQGLSAGNRVQLPIEPPPLATPPSPPPGLALPAPPPHAAAPIAAATTAHHLRPAYVMIAILTRPMNHRNREP
jgi:hypothetical protein